MASLFQRITIDGRTYEGDDVLRWSEALVRDHDRAAWALSLAATLRELTTGSGALTAHTSGTTGPPKPFVLAPDDLITSARLTIGTFGLASGDRVLLCLPCDFVAGKLMVVRAFVGGLDLHAIDPAGNVLDRLRSGERFRFAAMVPQQLQQALTHDRARTERLFDTVLLGGGPVGRTSSDAVQGLSTRVFHGYGSTETLTHVALRAMNGPGRSDLFHALGAISFSTDDHDRLVVHTPHLHTKSHRTNDVVELIDAHRFRWLGRYDNVILSGGKKFFPEELEARTAPVIARPHFFLAEADEQLGQRVVLVLEGDAPSPAEERTLREALERVLTKHERPKRIVALRSFRRTSSGKVVRSLG